MGLYNLLGAVLLIELALICAALGINLSMRRGYGLPALVLLVAAVLAYSWTNVIDVEAQESSVAFRNRRYAGWSGHTAVLACHAALRWFRQCRGTHRDTCRAAKMVIRGPARGARVAGRAGRTVPLLPAQHPRPVACFPDFRRCFQLLGEPDRERDHSHPCMRAYGAWRTWSRAQLAAR